jgi:NhaP-type Na+/H+ or K+/H+ antiporter
VVGANKLLPATFLVIVGTVALYGLTAVPLARMLGLQSDPEVDEPSEALPP